MRLPITVGEDLVGDDEAEKEGAEHVVIGAVAGEGASVGNGFGDEGCVGDGYAGEDFGW